MFKSSGKSSGPKVKTGPNRGLVRSRKNNGAWRSKRSDSGLKRTSKRGGSGFCFITTAAVDHFSMEDKCYELETLRWFRDSCLLSTPKGRALVAQYYKQAPVFIAKGLSISDHAQNWSSIKKCVNLIDSNHYGLALLYYKRMFFRLRNRALPKTY